MENNLGANDYNKVSPLSVSYCENVFLGKWKSAYHNVFEIYYLVDGTCNFFVDDKIYTLYSGDMLLIPPYVFHRAIYDEKKTVTRYVVSYDTTNILPKTRELLGSIGYYIERIPRSLGDAEKIFLKIWKEYSAPHLLSGELISGYITELAALIHLAEKSRKSTDVSCDNSVIELAVAYLKNNYANDISVDDVSRHVSVSKAHLSRMFKAETGLGIKEYLTVYRIKQAEFMLSEFSAKPISEIAYDCGFNDSNYFASLFKKTVGVTPTEFRKKISTKQD